MNEKMRIFISGGHLTPALAVIDEIKKNKDWEIFFIGRKYPLEGDKAISQEYKIIKELNIPFLPLVTGRLQRKFTSYTLLSLLKIPLGFIQSFYYLLKYKPKVVLSFGGYVAFPISIISFLLGIPVFTHEQTKIVGLSNRLIGLLAKKVFISYPESQKYFSAKKIILTGNPLRKEIWEQKMTSWQKDIRHPLLYITGGSLGSHQINVLIYQIIEELLKDFFVIHQVGESQVYRDLKKLEIKRLTLASHLKKRYFLKAYINRSEIGWVLNQADLIIARSGANTVSEIIALFKPAIFIPLPYALEQKENAKLVESLGLAKVLDQESLTAEKLLSSIRCFWEDIKKGMKKRGGVKKKEEKKDIISGKDAALLIVKEIYGIRKA